MQWPFVDVVSEFIKFDTISKGLKIGFKKYKIKLLIFLKKEVSHLCGTFSLLFSFLLLRRAAAFQALKIYFINSRFVLNVFALFLFLAIFLHDFSPLGLYFIL